jgi:hypothetical protein
MLLDFASTFGSSVRMGAVATVGSCKRRARGNDGVEAWRGAPLARRWCRRQIIKVIHMVVWRRPFVVDFVEGIGGPFLVNLVGRVVVAVFAILLVIALCGHCLRKEWRKIERPSPRAKDRATSCL